MFALSFDMVVSDLEIHYGKPYNKAYYDIKKIMLANGFEWIQGSTYLAKTDDLGVVFKALMELRKIEWFPKSVKDIRGYRVEDWSNFTPVIKGD